MIAVNASLFDAAREGRAEEVRTLLASGADANAVWSGVVDHGAFLEDLTPLMVAAASPRSNVATVRALLEAGADLWAVSAGEVTALWYAAGGGTGYPPTEANLRDLDPAHPYRDWGGGDVERLRALLDAGADPNESASNGRSAVGEACSVGDPRRLALLIERGGSVQPSRPRDRWGASVPLFQAAASGSVECVRLVLAQGFPADYEQGGKTALHEAKGLGVAQALLDAGATLKRGLLGAYALDEALARGEFGIASALIARLPEGERQRELDRQLMSAAGRRQIEAVEALLAWGADAARPDPDFGSALHYCCWVGDSSCQEPPPANTAPVIEMLVRAGADVELRDRHGATALHEAASGDWGAPSAIRALLRLGAQIDPFDLVGRTPLMLAADHGEVECARLLLEAGANPDWRDAKGRTARTYARRHLESWESIAHKRAGRLASWLIRRALRWTREDVDGMNDAALANAQAVARLLGSDPRD